MCCRKCLQLAQRRTRFNRPCTFVLPLRCNLDLLYRTRFNDRIFCPLAFTFLFSFFFLKSVYTCVLSICRVDEHETFFETFNRAKSSFFICESLSILPGSSSLRYTNKLTPKWSRRFAFYENSLVSVSFAFVRLTDVDFQYMYFSTYIPASLPSPTRVFQLSCSRMKASFYISRAESIASFLKNPYYGSIVYW